ncbi:MAG: hypothetical protein Q9182_002986 [Xanthomendoza sp. 2 TL-2023]
MASHSQFLRPMRTCMQCLISRNSLHTTRSRAFCTNTAVKTEASLETASSTPEAPPPRRFLDPNTVATPRLERRLLRKTGQNPIGSRRRRAALQSTSNIPFEQLPYQCFQEARKLLLADRQEKLKQIEEERRRIAKVQAIPALQCGGEHVKKGRLVRMQKFLEELKIWADINDPIIKKRFEDGQGDLNRPIYRHLADKQWRQHRRLILMQRINQMHVVPDVVPYLNPTVEVKMCSRGRFRQPGDFLGSWNSEFLPPLRIHVFDRGERFVSVIVVDPDVPNLETDSFDSRCHYFAANIPISPTAHLFSISSPPEGVHILRPWLPPHAQKGSPYHRLVVLVLEQKDGQKMDVPDLEKLPDCRITQFNVRSCMDKMHAHLVGVYLFRTIWDENTAGVMQRAGIGGADIELKRKKPEKLPYKKKNPERYR